MRYFTYGGGSFLAAGSPKPEQLPQSKAFGFVLLASAAVWLVFWLLRRRGR